MQECKICHHPRFKPRRRGGKKKHKDIPFKQLSYLPLAPRLQRLYTSKITAEHMRWHKETLSEDGKLCHPRDGEAWKHFDQTYPSFAIEPRNVRLALSTDGFNPHNQGWSTHGKLACPYAGIKSSLLDLNMVENHASLIVIASFCHWIIHTEIKKTTSAREELKETHLLSVSWSVNLDDFSMYGMKSHDCHVFMEKLLPIAFCDLLPESVWNALTELSLFFRDLCSIVLLESNVKTLEENIIVTLCKLEKIFPPSFFDSMEHLPIHLAYEARCGGPIQYRWMYPFERRYDAKKYAELSDLTPKALGVMRDKEFASWFFNYVENPTNGVTETDIKLFSRGFSSIVKRWNGYFVNGYRFHTLEYGETNSTMNSGVCISGSYYDDASIDYYGELTEILELSFLGLPIVLWLCSSVDGLMSESKE
ncbi:UNVERIFIED_CONTAM: hypothetical protein Sradi_7014600 [Sesamum radiatum]|uniref:DUF4218 domain-containing protein n=1 Tax=Sesamum radiatum TaxID=300843 RepID=A0AAW2JDX7_SESRA